MKRFPILTFLGVAFLLVLSMAVTAVYEPYGSYGPYGASDVAYTAETTYDYGNAGYYEGYGPSETGYGPNYYRYLDQWGPFDFKLSRTVTNDVVADLIDNFEYEDADLLFVLADLNEHDAFDRDYVLDHYLDEDDFNCLNVDVYNALADLDQYDKYDTIDLDNLDRDMLTPDFLRRFDYADYQTIANADNNDNIKPITANNAKELDFDDLDCYDLQDYNTIAALNPHDKWDAIDFTDFDDLDDLDKIGRKRVVFFHPEDFEQFNLYYATNPNWALYAPYLYGPFDIPDGYYGYLPPLRDGHPAADCYNNSFAHNYCNQYYEQGFVEQGYFEFNTDIRFDNEGRAVRGTNNEYGSRRTLPQHTQTYQPTYEGRYGVPLAAPTQPTQEMDDPAQVTYTATAMPEPIPTETQKESNLLLILGIVAVLLLLLILYLLKR